MTNAVNIPSIRAEDLELLGPYIPLAAKLGRLTMELAGGRAEQITLSYHGDLAGYDTRLLTVAALNGAFQGRVDGPVNYVNAPLVAAERGIEVRRGEPPRMPRLHEPRPGRGPLERRADPGRRDDDRQREPALARRARSASSSRSSSRR